MSAFAMFLFWALGGFAATVLALHLVTFALRPLCVRLFSGAMCGPGGLIFDTRDGRGILDPNWTERRG